MTLLRFMIDNRSSPIGTSKRRTRRAKLAVDMAGEKRYTVSVAVCGKT